MRASKIIIGLGVFLAAVSTAFAFDIESRLAKNIRQRLETLQGLGAHEIVIEDRRGAVTLSGFVASAIDQERVVNTVKEVEGVRTVTNYLEIRGRSVPTGAPAAAPIPGGVAEKAQKAILSKLSFSGPYKIDIKVAGGLVTLSGSVSTKREAKQAEEIIREVPGVTGVVNKITVPGE